MRLPESLRDKLKQPMGVLLPDCEATRENILKNTPPGAFLITVGDATTEKLIKFGLDPSLQIVDSLEKRHKRDPPEGNTRTVLYCGNPPSEITDESIKVIKEAFSEAVPVRVFVKGEEDLLVLPGLVHAPENSVVLYGQPDEGLVIVPVNQEARDKAKKIMDLMV